MQQDVFSSHKKAPGERRISHGIGGAGNICESFSLTEHNGSAEEYGEDTTQHFSELHAMKAKENAGDPADLKRRRSSAWSTSGASIMDKILRRSSKTSEEQPLDRSE